MEEQNIAFDKMAEGYEDFCRDNLKNTGFDYDYLQRYKVSDVLFEAQKHLKSVDNINILNYGCGIGIADKYLRELFPSAHLVSCDISSESIKQAQKDNAGINDLEYKLIDGKSLSFDKKFDIVFIENVMRHIPRANQVETIKMIKENLKDDGFIIMYEFNPFNPVAYYCYRKYDRSYDPENVRIMTPGYSKKIFKSAGFEKREIVYRFFIPNCFKKLVGLEKYLKKCPIGANYYIVVHK